MLPDASFQTVLYSSARTGTRETSCHRCQRRREMVFARNSKCRRASRCQKWTNFFLAPDLLGAEVADTFWKKHRRKELTDEESTRLIDDLQRLDITMVPHQRLLSDAFALAATASHPVYDCLYLALAHQNDCQLVTADRRFYKTFSKSEQERRIAWIEDQ